MKIALVNHTFSLSHGGLERFSVNLATALHHEGHTVCVFAHRWQDLPEGIQICFVPMAKRPGFWRVLSFAINARSLVTRETFDVVYGLTRCFGLNLYRLGDGVQRHWMRLNYPFAPWRWLNYMVNPVQWANLYLERTILGPGGPWIITNSKLVQRHVQRYYGSDPKQVHVIYNGVEPSRFNPQQVRVNRDRVRSTLGLKSTDKALLYVSNNWKRKGLSVLLRAVADLGDVGNMVHVLVVGRGKPAHFLRLSERLGIATRVHLIGATDQVENYYGAADLAVLPTMYDPFSNVCLEAMACGLPVITTAENGASELICPGENGFIQSNPRSWQELSALLRNGLKSDLTAMGEAARTRVAGMTRQQNMRETLDVIRKWTEASR
ncbi:MAG: glycosyltransferase family 4 protein [Desulfuromonadales bacterium]|nr:glycosyltransferase family 4 protein [Desulfuromonadales bacterium]